MNKKQRVPLRLERRAPADLIVITGQRQCRVVATVSALERNRQDNKLHYDANRTATLAARSLTSIRGSYRHSENTHFRQLILGLVCRLA